MTDLTDSQLNAREKTSPAPLKSVVDRPFGERQIGTINWIGVWTLYKKEVRRFLKVAVQTVLAPVMSSLLFLVVFMLALGQDREAVAGVPFVEFLAPGLIMMAILNNAFANASSSILVAKLQGSHVDFLTPPLSARELTAGFVGGAMTRGVMVGLATWLGMALVMGGADVGLLSITHLGAVVYFAVAASMLLGLLGIIGGVWADKFDHMAAVTNFIITPMAFLSGTFYSITKLPPLFQNITHWNPIFYLIDGFRYGFTGVHDAPILQGVIVTFGLNALLLGACYYMFKSGYKLKS